MVHLKVAYNHFFVRTYIFFACFCFAMGAFVWVFIPETKGVSLERMDELFGGPQMAMSKRGDSVQADNTGKTVPTSNIECV